MNLLIITYAENFNLEELEHLLWERPITTEITLRNSANNAYDSSILLKPVFPNPMDGEPLQNNALNSCSETTQTILTIEVSAETGFLGSIQWRTLLSTTFCTVQQALWNNGNNSHDESIMLKPVFQDPYDGELYRTMSSLVQQLFRNNAMNSHNGNKYPAPKQYSRIHMSKNFCRMFSISQQLFQKKPLITLTRGTSCWNRFSQILLGFNQCWNRTS